MAKRVSKKRKTVETLTHEEASRKNIPTAELESVVPEHHAKPIVVAFEREAAGLDEEKAARNRDLDPQLVWRGKDEQDWSDIIVHAPPLYIQEKVHPKVLIDDLMRCTQYQEHEEAESAAPSLFPDLFADFNGLPSESARTEFYQHDANWTNRMILGDSLQVMASLAEREGLRGQVQCIYIDPPYGIKFNSNFQWSTTSRDVKDGNVEHITREPEQVKAFRDTWRDGIHSYLTYLRDRLTVARDLLADSGSIFVQIGDENVHCVRALMDEVFGVGNFIALVTVTKTTSSTNRYLAGVADYVLFYGKDIERTKYRTIWRRKEVGGDGTGHYNMVVDRYGRRRSATLQERAGALEIGARLFTADQLQSASMGREKGLGAASWFEVSVEGRKFLPTNQTRWKTNEQGMARLGMAARLVPQKNALRYMRTIDDFAAYALSNVWTDLGGASDKHYVVETAPQLVERCVLMATDPGDLVLDPTCGSGTTAYVAEQWGRRWITVDTSRVSLALARARIMGARYPFYLLADSAEGHAKEAAITRGEPSNNPTNNNLRQGFVYERVPHIMLSSIVRNSELDVIWDKMQPAVEITLAGLNGALRKSPPTPYKVKTGGRAGKTIDFSAPEGKATKLPSGDDAPAGALLEWEVPLEAPDGWPTEAKQMLEAFWKARIDRQTEIDASIAAKTDSEYLYDKPYEDRSKVRVAGPFTVESISPHRAMDVDENDELIDPQQAGSGPVEGNGGFVEMILQNLKTAGVQQAHKEDKIDFSSITGWPGSYICAEGMYSDGESHSESRRAGIFIGPEFGTVSRQDLVLAAREAGDAGFDVLIACAFNYDAHSSEFDKLGRIPVLKARMNADLHMADDLKNTGKGNLFVIFGEPDIDILPAEGDGTEGSQIQVRINGVDVFHPNTGEVRSDGAEGIACWFIDTDYNGESFFVRHAYFLGASDPYKSLKTTLRSEINEDAWETLHSDTSRPFGKPDGGRIAVKVINHLGDEVMKVFKVE
jgi:adenine-specific DNA-methyltransferase